MTKPEACLASRTCSRCRVEFVSAGACNYCPPCNAQHSREYKRSRYGVDPQWTATYRAREKGYRDRNRAEALAAYGGRCACCGEAEPVFLDIDHVGGGGTQHRKTVGDIYVWLRRNGWPPNFRVLCRNCNWAEHRGGCPHLALSTVWVGSGN